MVVEVIPYHACRQGGDHMVDIIETINGVNKMQEMSGEEINRQLTDRPW